ncbi:MAG: hypothetical protein IT208_18140 [Chthonomonadales bacterium]|nr:hypothetical protein [Chthonomonadales bacterium]
MRCEAVRARIQRWFDDRGAGSIPAEVAGHLQDCGECRVYIRTWNGIELQLCAARDGMGDPSPALARAIRNRIAEERAAPAPQRRPWAWFPYAAAGAVAAAVLLFALYAVGYFGRRATPSTIAARSGRSRPAQPPGVGAPALPGLTPSLPLANTR